MKIKLILIFLLAYFSLFSQNWIEFWNDEVELDIFYIGGPNYYHRERFALFANHYGIHMLKAKPLGENRNLNYFLLNSQGEIVRATNFENEYGDFTNIVGNESIIYIIYQKDNSIQVKASVDGGISWSSRPQISMTTSFCNGIDAAFSDYGHLHVVWSEKVGGYYESYFKMFDGINWGETQALTNVTPIENGGMPTITTSYYNGVHRAHVSINKGNGDNVGANEGQSFTRDYNYENNSWSNPIAIIPPSPLSKIDRLLVTEDGLIHSFSYIQQLPYSQFLYKQKSITDPVWPSEGSSIIPQLGPIYGSMQKLSITKSDLRVLAFWMHAGGGFMVRRKTFSSLFWSEDPYQVASGVSYEDLAVTSASNDIYTVWAQYDDSPIKYKFRHYDHLPSSPFDLVVTQSQNNHPLLSWSGVSDPDLDHYKIYRKITEGLGFQYLATTTSTSYEDTELYYPYPHGTPETFPVWYYVKAVDINSHESEESNTVVTYVGGRELGKEKTIASINAIEYSLDQNYPNPFNPTTTIDYSIKWAGLVTLKVYDMLGVEVATLVNENKEPGSYSVTFNATDLPSGIYVYRLTANDFTSIKKLMLVK